MTTWLLTLWSLFVPNQRPLATMNPEGAFRQDGENSKSLNWTRPHEGEIGYDTGAGPNTGVIRSGRFRLPSTIHFYTAGFLSRPGMRIYLEDEPNKRTLDLRQRIDPGFEWRLHFWKIPLDWHGASVRLVAEDNGTGENDWVGITAPKADGEPLAYSVARAINRTGLLVYMAVLFLLPGVTAALWISRKAELESIRLASAVLCGSGTASFLAFWVYLASPAAGKIFSVAVLLTSAVFVVRSRRALPRLPAFRETAGCLGFAIMLSVFYNAVGFLYITDDGIGEQAQVRFNPGSMPPDNLIPEIMAARLRAGESLKPPLVAFWQSSDRPPLQTGATLLVFPLTPITLTLAHQLLGVFLQCLSVVGLWALVRAAELGNGYLVPILGFAIFSEVCSFHAFYVWPKLMAAGFMLLGVAFVVRARWSYADAGLASAVVSLGLLSHTGIVFTILPLAVYALLKRSLPGWKQLCFGLAVTSMFLLPWRWFQAVYDPPGDFLLKFNTTYAQHAAELRRPFEQLLVESYGHMTPGAYLDSKLADLKALYTGVEMDGIDSSDWRRALADFGTGSFFHLFWATGVLNIAFLCRFFAKPSAALRLADGWLWMLAGAVLLWMLVLFPPGATILHQWSLANVLLLFLVLVIYLIESRPQIVYPLLALQAFCIFPLLIFAKPWIEEVPRAVFDAPLDPGMAAVALAALSVIVYSGWRAKLQEVV